MAYSVDWITKVILVPKTDLVAVSASPEIYDLNVVNFWVAIHDIQDGEGITYLDIMRSNAPVTLSGTTDARVVEIINGYTVEFENGSYQINLTTAKSNLLDVRVPNSVSLNNQAGIIVSGSSGGSFTQDDRDDLQLARDYGAESARNTQPA